MRKPLLLIFVFIACFYSKALTQQAPVILQRIKEYKTVSSPFTRLAASMKQWGNEKSISLPVQKEPEIKKNVYKKLKPSSNLKPGNTPCFDTSLRLYYSKPNGWFASQLLTKLSDGNIIMSGLEYDTIKNTFYPMLVKMNQRGDTLWSRVMIGGFQPYGMEVYKAFELNDNSLIVAGNMNIPMPYNGRTDMLLVRVTATGELIWEKTFKSTVWNQDTTTGSMEIKDCKQDTNGDVYLCGNTRIGSLIATGLLAKMDVNGNVMWSNTGAFAEMGAFSGIEITTSSLLVFGRTAIYNSRHMPIVSRVDKSSGSVIASIGYLRTKEDFYHDFMANEYQKLDNGNFIMWGRGLTDMGAWDSTHRLLNIGVLELTPTLDVVRAYSFNSAYSKYGYQSTAAIFKDGSGSFSRIGYKSGLVEENIFGSFEHEQVLKERVVSLQPSQYLSWVNNFIQLDDGGQLVTTFLGDYATKAGTTEVFKLHNSDTAGSCLGTDTTVIQVEQEHYEKQLYDFVVREKEVLVENQHPFYGVFNNSFFITSNCKQVNFCDTLLLSAPNNTVCLGNPVTIKMHKNRECGASPTWSFDSTAVQLYKNNDSIYTVTVNKAWQGTITASINGCGLLLDSVRLTVLPAPGPVDLGPDTVICPGNTVLLNAHKGYVTYQWQNGSTDSTFTVSAPGKYFVTVTDACGGIFSDTVLVQPHAAIPLEIGPNINICKNDSIVIPAPLDFIHYKWTGSNISNDTLSTIVARPVTNGWYTLTAEKTPGCFAKDSLFVTVTQVPAIRLGTDTSFCAGQSITLNAGPGFTAYTWSTGAASQTITVTTAGQYTVAATLNGCMARDTLQVLNVYPLPVFSLGNDTSLCTGQVLSLGFNLSQATYQWNNGSNLPQFTISQPGQYWLQVSQQGCVKRDSITVQFKPLPLVRLGNDTSLCENQTLLLNAFNANATYLWQDGTSTSNYSVTRAGTYYVKASINGCSSADTIAITYKRIPRFTLGPDTVLCAGNQYVLAPVINTPVDYLWQDGSTAASYTVTNEGLYTLQVSNECGSLSDEVAIGTTFCNIVMPTAFTPNGDGLNDVFKVKFLFPVQRFRLIVYNRFGEKVFETSDIGKGWDGTWHGKVLAPAAYVWHIEYATANKSLRSLKGTITLLR